jgi:hypothetical protein
MTKRDRVKSAKTPITRRKTLAPANKVYHRGDDLTAELNAVLKEIMGHEKDFEFSNDHLVQLKRVLSSIHALLTFRTTVLAMKWLRKHFSIPKSDFDTAMKNISSTSPYTFGFDILLDSPKIVAEVKCYIPINNGKLFGTAQVNGILGDAIKLDSGKKPLLETKEYFKFIFVSKVRGKTNNAITEMLKEWKMTSSDAYRKKMNEIKKRLVFENPVPNKESLTKGKIYIVEV